MKRWLEAVILADAGANTSRYRVYEPLTIRLHRSGAVGNRAPGREQRRHPDLRRAMAAHEATLVSNMAGSMVPVQNKVQEMVHS